MHRASILAACFLAAPILAISGHAQRVSRTALARGRSEPGSENAKTVEIRTRDDLLLAASYFEPRSKKQLAPAVILVHDSGNDARQMLDLGEKLWKAGFAVLAVDLRGHGRSATDRCDWNAADDDARNRFWRLAPRDLDAAAHWLRSRKEVHATNLNLVGLRSGCALAVRHASRDENVRAVVLLGPSLEEYGFDVAEEIQELEGLPTYIASKNDQRPATEAMVAEAHQASGHPYIDLLFCSARKEQDLIEDRKLQSSVAKWLKEKAMPKRSRR